MSGERALARYVSESIAWLSEREAVLEAVRDTRAEGVTVSEWLLHLSGGSEGKVELPLAVVGEEGPEGLLAVRMYHSVWALEGKHRPREPLLRGGGVRLEDLPEIVRAYQKALAEGDLEGIVATFAPQGCAREPAGGRYSYRGEGELRELYASLFGEGGGIGLEHCAVVDDGWATAIEYNVVRWGNRPVSPSPGVAVYERDETGLIAAARIYDDVEVP